MFLRRFKRVDPRTHSLAIKGCIETLLLGLPSLSATLFTDTYISGTW